MARDACQRTGNSLTEFLGRRHSAHIRREPVCPLREYGFHAVDDRCRGRCLSKMVEHHGACPNLSDRVGDALPSDIRCRTVYRLEETRIRVFGIDIAAGRNTDGSSASRTQVREYVSEEIAGDDNVEPIRVHDEPRGQDVDVIFVDGDLREALRHCRDPLVPKGIVIEMPLLLVADVGCLRGR